MTGLTRASFIRDRTAPFGDAEAGGDIGGGHALIGENLERLELIGGVHFPRAQEELHPVGIVRL